MAGELRGRIYYSDVLYTKAMKSCAFLLDQSNVMGGGKSGSSTSSCSKLMRERKFSLVSVIEQFTKAVRQMEEVVLVPTRLLDMDVKGSESSTGGASLSSSSSVIPDLNPATGVSSSSNLFEVFHLLKKMRDKMQALAVTSEEEMLSPGEYLEGREDILSSFLDPKVMDNCDSGLWSLSSSASRESIDACLESSSIASPPASNSPSAFSVSSSAASSSDDRSSHSGDSEACSVADSVYVVKKSLLSAKSLCSFLSEMTAVANTVVSRYLQEMQCGLCE